MARSRWSRIRLGRKDFEFQTAQHRHLPAQRSNPWRSKAVSKSGLLRCARNGGETHLRILAACFLREVFVYFSPSNQRAQGMPGARCTRSLAYDKKTKYTSVVTTGHTGITRHSPRNGFNGCSVLAPVLRACWPPSSACLNANLTPASRCQAHTSLPSASGAPVRGTIRVHRIPPRVS
jgi:hypothetical protein